jgi:hypothetical protein
MSTYAPTDRRYIGLYYYSSYWDKWDLIIGFDRGWWIVKGILPDDQERRHCTHLDANHFADKPFKVRPSTPLGA